MKFLNLTVLAGILFTMNAKAVEPLSASAGIVTTTVGTVCAIDFISSPSDSAGWGCFAGVVYSPLSSSTVYGLLLLKEDMQQVSPDAYNFLAGEEISLALEEQMNRVRENAPELADASPEQIAAVMLEIAHSK